MRLDGSCNYILHLAWVFFVLIFCFSPDRLQDEGINEDLIHHVEDRLGHDRRYGIDPSKIKADLGWYPETPFEVGIVKTIDWYLENEEWMKRVTSGDYQKYYETMYRGRQ